MRLGSIYGLADPRAPEIVRYVGQSIQPRQRLWGHLAEARSKSRSLHVPVYRWMRRLLKSGLAPVIAALEYVPAHQLDDRERYWISRLNRMQGRKLLNQLETGKWHHSADTRLRMSHAGRRAWANPRRRKEWSRRMRARCTPKYLRKLSKAHTGKKPSLETRRKCSRSMRRVWANPRRRRRMVLAQRHFWANPRRREEWSRRMRARSTPKYLRKLSLANTLAWQRRRRGKKP